jgi:hypothetical protein
MANKATTIADETEKTFGHAGIEATVAVAGATVRASGNVALSALRSETFIIQYQPNRLPCLKQIRYQQRPILAIQNARMEGETAYLNRVSFTRCRINSPFMMTF